ncbi:MAG: DUF364 domain-containing protein [Oscillospiraceae bacterium]|nr:DUF364 domain-containing protein [Oscillospiraceae bacterium]
MDNWQIYDALISGVKSEDKISFSKEGGRWSYVETQSGCGVAMSFDFDSRPPLFPGGIEGLSLSEAAEAVKSWNFKEASLGLAAINAFYNTPARMEALGCGEPYKNYCTRGLDFKGATVGLIGHLKMPEEALKGAKQVCILEQRPQPGDYPDPACEYLLPECDVVLITGSTLVNKTLPRLLQLCEAAYTILVGPSVPLCPALLKLGVNRLAGMAVVDREGAREHVVSEAEGPPYPFGQTFLLAGEPV